MPTTRYTYRSPARQAADERYVRSPKGRQATWRGNQRKKARLAAERIHPVEKRMWRNCMTLAEAAERAKLQRAAYAQSDKGKAAKAAYATSDKGKAARKRANDKYYARRAFERRVDRVPEIQNPHLTSEYAELAKTTGISPCQLQAVTWVCWRRLHGVVKAQE